MAPAMARLIAGSLPPDMPRGAVLKNGPNPRPEHASEQGGWLDGDGLVHCVVLPPDGDHIRYSRTWVRTEGFSKEQAAGRRLFDGSLVAPRGLPLLWALLVNGLRAFQPQKDTANTGLLPLGHGGRCLALMEQCLPSELCVGADGSVTTVSPAVDFGGRLRDFAKYPFAGGALTAHLKTDPATGQAVGVTYSSNGPPGVYHTVLASDGTLVSHEFVPLAGSVQTMVHDCAVTSSEGSRVGGFTLLLDLPLTVRPARMLRDRFPVEYEPSAGARIGLCPRSGAVDGVTWCDVQPGVVLHTVNAHESEDGRLVTLTALRSEPSGDASFIERYASAFLHRWVLDVRSGVCVEEATLSPVPLEFPTIDGRLTGTDARYAYAIAPCTIGGPNQYGPPFEGIVIDALVKLDLRTGAIAGRWRPPEGFYLVSEPTFLPKHGSSAGEGDEGYLLIWVSSTAGAARAGTMPQGDDGRASVLCVVDAETMGAHSEASTSMHASSTEDEGVWLRDGTVAAVELPGAVPYGLHSCWMPFEELPSGGSSDAGSGSLP